MDVERIKSPNCLGGKYEHDVGDGEVGDYEGMQYISCSKCFERFFLVSETVMKKSGLYFVPKGVNRDGRNENGR